jgi:fructose-bisphosphate aldolase, class II
MKLISARPLVLDAHARGYAVPAFNTNSANYEMTRAALEAAQELRSPLILQEYEPNAVYRGFDYLVMQVGTLGDELGITVPVALHLDHGHSFESVVRAIRAGFTSVMIDASHQPLAANAALARKVLEVARPLGVSVEAEIGYVPGNEPVAAQQVGRIPVPPKPAGPAARVTPDEAAEFMAHADVDMLAVAVGTVHGVYQAQTDIDCELIRAIRARVDVPLVQHGTGGISLRDLTCLKDAGMAKVNFGEGFRYDYIRHFADLTEHAEHRWHPWRIMQEVKNRLRETMKELIRALGADNKA